MITSRVYLLLILHPSEVHKCAVDDLDWIRQNITNPKVIGIGEIGLDYYWDTSYKEKQITYFLKQLQLAEELNYPVVIHSRSAALDTYECLQKYQVKGVMHCYAYSLEMASKFIDLGYALGIGGVVTFKNAHLKEVVKEVPLEHLVTETDAPYLAPTPYRGEVNEPKYTKIIILEIAKIKNLDLEIVEEAIFKNFQRIFNIKEV